MIIPKPNHLGQRAALVTPGFDAAHFADCRQWTLGFDDQSCKLDDPAAAFDHTRLSYLGQRAAESGKGRRTGSGCAHAAKDFCKAPILVSRRASIVPNRVFTMQPPRLTSAEH